MTPVEERKRVQLNLRGAVRLACQIVITQDMIVRPLLTGAGSGLSDPGPRPEPAMGNPTEPQKRAAAHGSPA